ncbi:myosin light chain kinase 2, skeletal/cardiac muscle isoform X2 [Myripristis murdjan]|uniref:myosin light chain kinase 2, skeletal/cardiac muscle isoform X2 n=1 Tax=Myripristis murdjan TaxID=586833 RepID=UPI0011760979|nr:myosin light chain kinase 2, skeletal/cardiac muscle-like isoform X2 [Myripristis murdjan]
MRYFWEMKSEVKNPTSNKAVKAPEDITPACEPNNQEASAFPKIKLHGPKHFLASRKCGNFLKDHKVKDGKEKPCMSLKGLKAQKKKKPPDTADTVSLRKQALLLEEVQKLNRENAEKSRHQLTPGSLDLEAGVSPEDANLDSSSCNLLDYLREDSKVPVAERDDLCEGKNVEEDGQKGNEDKAAVKETETKLEEDLVKEKEEGLEVPEEKEKEKEKEEATAAKEDLPQVQASEPQDAQKDPIPISSDDHKGASPFPEAEQDQLAQFSASSKRHVTDDDAVVEDHKKSRVEEGEEEEEEEEEEKAEEEDEKQNLESDGWAVFRADGVEIQMELKQRVEKKRQEENVTESKDDDDDDDAERYFIDNSPPPAAPFNHRIVSAKPNQINNFYTINRQEVLGGGRFGQVHKCVENSSGLTLAAKIIKARSQKEKEVVKNEIQVMNQLDHASLIQLYAAYESRNDIILVLEYVDGGELFDRIIDENYTLMELDAVMFIRQICEGLQHMHKMYILHLDLKPENILCVSRATNKIKIIDFGLARIYKPREKLRVNFGTPEFLAPEVINYDFVSFNTDMWSLGVITYMLLSGLCPFLGDDDNETLNNILSCKWGFEEEEFRDTSSEAKDFITRLLVVNKSWRMGTAEALRHPWLSDPVLHHHLYSKKTMCKSRRSSIVPPTDS